MPSESVANASIPRSMPVSWPVAGKGCVGTSAQEKQTYRPSASREVVTVLVSLRVAGPAHRHTPDLRQNQEAVIQSCAAMLAHLRIGEAVVAVAAMITGIAGCLRLFTR